MPRSNSRSSNPPRSSCRSSHALLATQPCCWRCASWGLCRKFEYRLACGMCFGQPHPSPSENHDHTHVHVHGATTSALVYVCICVCVLFIGGGNSCNHHHQHHLELNNNNNFCSAVRQLRRHYLHYTPCIHLDHRQTLCHLSTPSSPSCAPCCAICSNLKRCLWSRSVCELPLCVCY